MYYLSLYLLESFSSIAYAICYSCVFKSGDEIFAIISINIMSKLATRVILLVLFFATSYIIWEKQEVFLSTRIRESRFREKSTAEVKYPHIGQLEKMKITEPQTFQHSSLLDWLSFDKKINTYTFTFYNWYHFELEFVDLGYESYIEFRSFTEDHLHDRWKERIGFSLEDSFYPQGGKIKLPVNEGKNCSGCKCKERGMNFDISNNVFNISVRQYTVQNLSDSRHDGYKYSRFWYYTPNRSLDDPSNEPFKNDLTVTTFNFTYKEEDHIVEANLTHIMRHNQCISFLDEENQGVFRHKCFGGYSNGRIFIDKKIAHEELGTYGKWVKSAYNLDNNRSRTFFEGVRSTKRIAKRIGQEIVPRTNWHWSGFKAIMQCFSKPEYYSKHENIEKERYVGLHFGRPYGQAAVQNFQDYIFFNGKIHPVYNIDYKFSENYQRHRNITFRGAPSKELYQPSFEVNFTVLSQENYREDNLITERNERRAYGFWSGWFDEGRKGQRVNFFNISGYIETVNSVY